MTVSYRVFGAALAVLCVLADEFSHLTIHLSVWSEGAADRLGDKAHAYFSQK